MMNIMSSKELKKFVEDSRAFAELKQTRDALLQYRNDLYEENLNDEILIEIDNDIQLLEEKISNCIPDIESRKKIVSDTISLIPDKVTATAARLHFISGLTWDMIAFKMKYSSAENARARFYRAMRDVRKNSSKKKG